MIIEASASNKSINFVEKPVILIVDDSRAVRLALRKILQNEYNLIEAGDGKEAWDLLLDNEPIQVVFSGLSMPEVDGFGLLERIRSSKLKRMSKIPFIAITGNKDDERILQRAHDCGATDLIARPFQSRDIKDRAHAYTGYLTDTEIHSSSVPLNLEDIDESVDNLASIDQILKTKRKKIIEPGIKMGSSDVTNLIQNDNNVTQKSQGELDKQYFQKEIRDYLHFSFEAEKMRRIEENESCASKEGSDRSRFACKTEETARQQDILELIQRENELETVAAFDVQKRIHSNDRDDQDNREETKVIRKALEKKLATERENQWQACSYFTRFAVLILEQINTLPWVNLDNKIKNILKHSTG